MRTLNSLGQRDNARMDRILRALKESQTWIRSDVLAESGGVARRSLARFIGILRFDDRKLKRCPYCGSSLQRHVTKVK